MDGKLRAFDSLLSHRQAGVDGGDYGKASRDVGLLGATLRKGIKGACRDRGGPVRKTLDTTRRVKSAAIHARFCREACLKGSSIRSRAEEAKQVRGGDHATGAPYANKGEASPRARPKVSRAVLEAKSWSGGSYPGEGRSRAQGQAQGASGRDCQVKGWGPIGREAGLCK